MTTAHLSTPTPVSPQLSDDEIDFEVAAALGRQKLIGSITIAAGILSSLYTFTKPVWEGSFNCSGESKQRISWTPHQFAADNNLQSGWPRRQSW